MKANRLAPVQDQLQTISASKLPVDRGRHYVCVFAGDNFNTVHIMKFLAAVSLIIWYMPVT